MMAISIFLNFKNILINPLFTFVYNIISLKKQIHVLLQFHIVDRSKKCLNFFYDFNTFLRFQQTKLQPK